MKFTHFEALNNLWKQLFLLVHIQELRIEDWCYAFAPKIYHEYFLLGLSSHEPIYIIFASVRINLKDGWMEAKTVFMTWVIKIIPGSSPNLPKVLYCHSGGTPPVHSESHEPAENFTGTPGRCLRLPLEGSVRRHPVVLRPRRGKDVI